MTVDTAGMPEARVAPRDRWSLIWLIPLTAASVAGWLAWQTLSRSGPEITLTFQSGDGLVPGQTRVRHKAVELGIVGSVRLSENLDHVVAGLRMSRDAEPFLTNKTRFWVVRPRISAGSISGLETLVSGAYIEIDPGERGGEAQYHFEALSVPPGIRSGEPGRTLRLTADRIGSLGTGSPILYRDIAVGEVLGYDVTEEGRGPVAINAFIRAPYDKLVDAGTRFWNASGISVRLGAEGLRVELESLQAALSGGIAFDASANGPGDPVAPDKAFPLYPTHEAATAAAYRQRIPVLAYFDSSARGLAVGAPVEMLGIQIGTVTEVGLTPDIGRGERPQVRVRLEIQPERFLGGDPGPPQDVPAVTRRLVADGLRAQLRTSNLLTGQQMIALDFQANAPPAEAGQEDGVMVLPTQGGGLDDLTATLAGIAAKIDAIPFGRIGQDLDAALRSATVTLDEAQSLIRQAKQGMGPALRELPLAMRRLNETLSRASTLLGSAESGYGQDSAVRREAQRMLEQASEAARSIRFLADYLNRQPDALLRGRAGETSR